MKEELAQGQPHQRSRQLTLAQLRELRAESGNRKTATHAPLLTPRGDVSAVRLTCAQERLWFLDQLGFVGSAYNLPFAQRLIGELDVAALQSSFAELIRRHESLRTQFRVADGKPFQVIEPSRTFTMTVHDLSVLPDAERSCRLRELSKEEAQRPFDLAAEALLRVTLLRLTPREHVLLLTLHHIVCDGWSLGILHHELGQLYAAYLQGRAAPLLDLPVQYADYAIWEEQWLQGDALEEHLSYWRKQLSGAPPQLQLPMDRPRPAIESFRGAELDFALPPQLSRGLVDLARRERVTLFMVVLSALAIVLSRWSGQRDIVVATSIAGRRHRELEGLIGCFVNTLLLRTDVQPDQTFQQLLRDVRETTLDAYAHQDLPFDQLVRDLRPERSLTRQPYFQVSLTLQNYPDEHIDLAGLDCSSIDVDCLVSHCDLTLHLCQNADSIAGRFGYATDLFDAATIKRMATHFRVVLEGILAMPQCPIGSLPLLTDDEKHRLLAQCRATSVPYPSDKLIHELFEAQVDRTPDAVALVHEERSFTYGELNARANQLAHYLTGRGVGPDELVALYVHRSADMLVGLLGTLKAGGAYVPLEPSDTSDRVKHVVADANPRVVLTHEALRSRLPQIAAEVIALDREWPRIAQESAANLDSRSIQLQPSNLAYVIYTSGSTGRPKGVMVEHRNIVNYAVHAARQFDVSSGSGSVLCTSISFDLALTSLYPTLLCGRTLRLCWEHQGISNLSETILNSKHLSPLKLTPSHLGLLVHALTAGRLRDCVRVLVLGGESLRADVLQAWRTHAPSTRVFNHYGPTETTVGCVVNEVTSHVSGAVPIGRPISNACVYVLDDRLQVVPVGVVGEIHVGGCGVARGYLHRPDLTAERFIADPFDVHNHGRMYRTGDLGRWRADGTLECLGRNDDQVKVRGYRIEPGEIEAQLARHEHVREVAVVAREDCPGERRLIAYLTVKGVNGGRPRADVLREYLSTRVPDYMMPSAFVVLEQLPVTPNGKLDRHALPVPDIEAYAAEPYEAPQGSIEEDLASIWMNLLKVQRVGRRDNFFRLGGHSLLAMELCARVAASFAIEVPLRALFEFPTIESLAIRIEDLRNARLMEDIDTDRSETAELLQEVVALSDEEVRVSVEKLRKRLQT